MARVDGLSMPVFSVQLLLHKEELQQAKDGNGTETLSSHRMYVWVLSHMIYTDCFQTTAVLTAGAPREMRQRREPELLDL